MSADHSGPLARLKADYDAAYVRAGEAARELQAARRERDRAREAVLTVMQVARRDGMTWLQIGEAMGVTGQAAAQFFKRGSP